MRRLSYVCARLCLYLAFSGCDSDTIRGGDLRWCYRLHAGEESWSWPATHSLSAFELLLPTLVPLQSGEGGRGGEPLILWR